MLSFKLFTQVNNDFYANLKRRACRLAGVQNIAALFLVVY